MKKLLLFLSITPVWLFSKANAQNVSSGQQPKVYRESAAHVNDLVHTRLEVRFDYKKRYLYGKEWVKLKPHFYPTDTLRLDAKGMDIKVITLIEKGISRPLKFTYDSLSLDIKLNKVYHNNQSYTVYIQYTAKPNELKVRKDAHGLYFINPDGTDKNKPIQIWTEGEPENSSIWFPTIDKPNQKTTSEISMTVPARYVTLSNGKLASKKNNPDGTRTDTWKMELPHSPYLFMMAVGDFKIYKDNWHGKEVSYYLEPAYAPYAKNIFGFTPEAIAFFSKITGVDYPWNKYSQIVVRDYVSGAMENTTAMVTGQPQQATKRELVDRIHDFGPVHELFHQWFGDYVTCESWSNLTLNESFADLGEILWGEYKYGQDAADEHIMEGLQGYLNNKDNATKNLVNFGYNDKKDVFNGVTYQKGGRVLNMLRHYLGNTAFYKGLNIYLKTNAFKNAEVTQLRLAMEEASGLDLNWFFNQWYYEAGHPVLNITYNWDEAGKTQYVYLQQTQEGQIFTLPMYIDIYTGGKAERHQVWMKNKTDTLKFHINNKPELVNVDAEKILVAQKTDNKPLNWYQFQYFNAPLYLDRYEAIDAAAAKPNNKIARQIIIAGLKDKYYGLRLKAVRALNMDNDSLKSEIYPILVSLAQNDPNTLVQAQTIVLVGKYKMAANLDLFKKALKSQSYTVQGAALWAINQIDTTEVLALAHNYEKDNKGDLSESIFTVYTANGSDAQWSYVYNVFTSKFGEQQFNLVPKFTNYMLRVKNPLYIQQGVAVIKGLGIEFKKYGIGPKIAEALNQIREQRIKLNDQVSVQIIEKALNEVNAK